MPVLRKIILSPKLPRPTLPYNHGVQVGQTLYCSGQLGMTFEGELVEGFVAQARLALENLGHVLRAAGSNYNDVIKVTVLLSDINNYDVMNSIYREYFTGPKFPARAAYQVAVLPRRGLIEIEAVAIVGGIIESKL